MAGCLNMAETLGLRPASPATTLDIPFSLVLLAARLVVNRGRRLVAGLELEAPRAPPGDPNRRPAAGV